MVVIFLVGSGFAIPSMFNLGQELRFGLSEQETNTLKMGGLYRVSRNPLYLGFYLIAVSSCIYTPHPFNVFFACIAIIIHHQIAMAEERFLLQQHGETYRNYMQQVRRYL